jgi:hypothetical protein
MFHESLLAPLQRTKFRSPDVSGFPFCSRSMHTVITPPWMPGGRLLLSAGASDATAPNAMTATIPKRQPTLGSFAISSPARALGRSAADLAL